MYVPLAPELAAHVHNLWFPYFGNIQNARVATLAINCGPNEAQSDLLGWQEGGLDITLPAADAWPGQDLHTRPTGYFAAHALGRQPYGFWNFFNPGGDAAANPVHRDHYFNGNLAHLDMVPWATRLNWGHKDLPNNVRDGLRQAGMPVFLAVLGHSPHLKCLVVRGTSAANFLMEVAVLLGDNNFQLEEFAQSPRRRGNYVMKLGHLQLGNRVLHVVSLNQFHDVSGAAAQIISASVNQLLD